MSSGLRSNAIMSTRLCATNNVTNATNANDDYATNVNDDNATDANDANDANAATPNADDSTTTATTTISIWLQLFIHSTTTFQL